MENVHWDLVRSLQCSFPMEITFLAEKLSMLWVFTKMFAHLYHAWCNKHNMVLVTLGAFQFLNMCFFPIDILFLVKKQNIDWVLTWDLVRSLPWLMFRSTTWYVFTGAFSGPAMFFSNGNKISCCEIKKRHGCWWQWELFSSLPCSSMEIISC